MSVFEAGAVWRVGGWAVSVFLNASESTSSRKITAPWSLLLLLLLFVLWSSCVRCFDGRGSSPVSHPASVSVWSSPQWEEQADCLALFFSLSFFPWFNSCKMQDILSAEGSIWLRLWLLAYQDWTVSPMCPHLHVWMSLNNQILRIHVLVVDILTKCEQNQP